MKIEIGDETIEIIKEMMNKEKISTLRIDYAENT
jgi:hypothetical protein